MPFGGYRDFAECVAKNQDKESPEGYCAAIQDAVENSVEGLTAAAASPGDGAWVRARPLQPEPVHGALFGVPASPASVTGLLTIVRSSMTGIDRYSVGGITVEASTVRAVDPPAS